MNDNDDRELRRQYDEAQAALQDEPPLAPNTIRVIKIKGTPVPVRPYTLVQMPPPEEGTDGHHA